ncbi:cytochrome-c oxidase [Meredithblackwellia eburnea MCA 4105]
MPIAPIQGALRKHLLTNLSIGIVGGTIAGYAFWYGHHVPKVAKREAWYLAAEKAKAEA